AVSRSRLPGTGLQPVAPLVNPPRHSMIIVVSALKNLQCGRLDPIRLNAHSTTVATNETKDNPDDRSVHPATSPELKHMMIRKSRARDRSEERRVGKGSSPQCRS